MKNNANLFMCILLYCFRPLGKWNKNDAADKWFGGIGFGQHVSVRKGAQERREDFIHDVPN